MKYQISKEFFPFSHFTPPISEKFLKLAVPNMKVPKVLWKDDELEVQFKNGNIITKVIKVGDKK